MPISDELIAQLFEGCSSPDGILGDALLIQLTKKVAERALNVEMNEHLGYAKNEPSGKTRVIHATVKAVSRFAASKVI